MIDMDRREQPFGKHDMLTKHNEGGRGKGIENTQKIDVSNVLLSI